MQAEKLKSCKQRTPALFVQLSQREIFGTPKIKIHPDIINNRRRALTSIQPSSADSSHRYDDAKMFLRAWIAVNNIETELSAHSGLRSRSLYDALNYVAKRIADNAGNTNNPDYERNFLIYIQHLRSLGLVKLICSVLCSGPLYLKNHFSDPGCRQYILNKIMGITTLRKIVGKQVGDIGESVGNDLSRDEQLLDYLFHCCAVPGLTQPSTDLFEDLYILRQECFVLPNIDELDTLICCLGDLQLALFTRILGISIRDLDKYQIRHTIRTKERLNNLEVQKRNLERIVQIPGLITKLLNCLKNLSIEAVPRYHNTLDENRTWHRYLDDLLSAQLNSGYNPGPSGQMSEDLLTYTALIEMPESGNRDLPANLAFQSTVSSIVVLNSSLSLLNFIYLLVSGPKRKSVVRLLINAGLLDLVLKPILERLLRTSQQASVSSDATSQMSSPEAVLKVHLFRLLQLVLHVAGADSGLLPRLVQTAFSSEEIDMLYDINSRLLVQGERSEIIENIHKSSAQNPRTCFRKGFLKNITDYFSKDSLPRWQRFWLCAILETFLRIIPKPAAFQIFFSRYDVIKTTVKCFLSACDSDMSPLSSPDVTMPNTANRESDLLNIEEPSSNDQPPLLNQEYASKPSIHETSLDLLAVLLRFNHRNIMRLCKDLPLLVSAPSRCTKSCSGRSGVHASALCETRWPSRLCTCSEPCNLRFPSGVLFCFLRHICDNVTASSLLLRSLLVTQQALPWADTVPPDDNELTRTTAVFMEAFGCHCLRAYICYKLVYSLDPRHLTQSETSALTTALTILVHSCKTKSLDRYINAFLEYVRRDSSNPSVNVSESSFMVRLKDLCEIWSNRFLNCPRIDFSSLHLSTRLQIEEFASMLQQVVTHPVIVTFNSSEDSSVRTEQEEELDSPVMRILYNRLSTSSQESLWSNQGDRPGLGDELDQEETEDEDFVGSERLIVLDFNS